MINEPYSEVAFEYKRMTQQKPTKLRSDVSYARHNLNFMAGIEAIFLDISRIHNIQGRRNIGRHGEMSPQSFEDFHKLSGGNFFLKIGQNLIELEEKWCLHQV